MHSKRLVIDLTGDAEEPQAKAPPPKKSARKEAYSLGKGEVVSTPSTLEYEVEAEESAIMQRFPRDGRRGVRMERVRVARVEGKHVSVGMERREEVVMQLLAHL